MFCQKDMTNFLDLLLGHLQSRVWVFPKMLTAKAPQTALLLASFRLTWQMNIQQASFDGSLHINLHMDPYGNIWGATRCHVTFAPAGTILHQKWGTGDWLWRLICLAKHPTAKHLLLPAMIVPHFHMIYFVKKLSVSIYVSMLFWPSHN